MLKKPKIDKEFIKALSKELNDLKKKILEVSNKFERLDPNAPKAR